MKLHFLEHILQALLMYYSANFFIGNAAVATTANSVDLIDMASKLGVVSILVIGIYVINKERNSLLDKMHTMYKGLLDEKDKTIKAQEEDIKFWRDKYIDAKA